MKRAGDLTGARQGQVTGADATETVPGQADDLVEVRVALAGRPYDVLIGPHLSARAADLIGKHLGVAHLGGRCAIVTDANVAAYHLEGLAAGLAARGQLAGTKVLPPGEGSKSFAVLQELCESLLAMQLERGDLVLALGGGVIGDLAGFAASILRRGIRYVQLPTTLLAQVDSSVGGKTAINARQGKNLIGTFHQPSLVLADIDLLATLPQRQFRAGYVEAVKYAMLGDAAYFDWLEANRQSLFRREPALLSEAIGVAVAGKAAIVARDETETGERMLLNLGHTFGHALEAWAGYSDKLLHGEAVAIGITLAFQLSRELGFTDAASAERVRNHLASAGLPTHIKDIAGNEWPQAEALLRLMAQDKKVRAGQLTLILARGIGRAFATRDVGAATVRDFLARHIG
jgi:3-dehydroquinate synthase